MQTNHDDQDWLALVAGDDVPGANPDTIREAQALRTAILSIQRQEASLPTDPTTLKRLLARLKIEGLLPSDSRDPINESR